MTHPHFSSPLLATISKRVRDESVLAYYHNAQLNFPSTKSLVDYLTSIDSATIRELRHISVRGDLIRIGTADENNEGYYGED